MLIRWSAYPGHRAVRPALIRVRFAAPGEPPDETPASRVVIAGLRRMVGKMLR